MVKARSYLYSSGYKGDQNDGSSSRKVLCDFGALDWVGGVIINKFQGDDDKVLKVVRDREFSASDVRAAEVAGICRK